MLVVQSADSTMNKQAIVMDLMGFESQKADPDHDFLIKLKN